jgi:hypothetical protein
VSLNPDRDRYLNFSFNTINNFHLNAGAPATVLGSSANANGTLDRYVYGAHIVYNQPLFLLAAHYVFNQDRFQKPFVDAFGVSQNSNQDNWGVSMNGEFRPLFLFGDLSWDAQRKISFFGRVDYWNVDVLYQDDRLLYIYGIAYRVNPFVRLILSGTTADHREGNKVKVGAVVRDDTSRDTNTVTFTAEVNW